MRWTVVAAIAFLPALAGCDPHPAAAPTADKGARRGEAARAAPRHAIVPKGERFACTPKKVWDGDGPIHCGEGPKVRLAGVAARELDGSCKPGHPCPDATAQAALDALAALLGRTTGRAPTGHVLVEGPALECLSEGSAKGDRTAAWCTSPRAGDLSCAMVASGTALKWARFWHGHSCSQDERGR